MTDNERLKKIIAYLVSQGIIDSQEDLANKLGYNPSAISQIVTGKKPLSKKFAKNIASISEKINIDYLFGKGEMLKNNTSSSIENNELVGQIKLLEKQLTEKEEKIDRLNREIGKLEEKLKFSEKQTVK